MSNIGFPELPLYQTAHTYFNVTRSPLVPGFIKGSVARVNSSREEIDYIPFLDNYWMGPSIALGWEKVLP